MNMKKPPPAGNPGSRAARRRMREQAAVPAIAADTATVKSVAPAPGRVGPSRRGIDRRVVLLAVLLAIAAALPFLIAGTGEFVAYDDNDYVFKNPPVAAGLSWAGARWALTTNHAANWHPLTWFSHMLDVTLFGMNPRGHHLMSVLLHAMNTALLFLALRRLTGALWPSVLVAALFGVHPLHVESVAWVAERKDVLSGLFFVLLLLAYERYVRTGSARWYLAVVVSFAAGLAAKPMLVTAPLVLLLLDFWPLGRARGVPARLIGRLCLEKLPLLALAAASSVVTFLVQRAAGAMLELRALPLPLRLANALVSYAAYVGSVLWPTGLAFYYPHPTSTIPWAQTAVACACLAAISLAAVAGARSRPFLLCGWLWYVGMLVPVIGIVQVGEQARADRYTYLPLIGIFLMAAWIPRTLTGLRSRHQGALATVGIALVVACGAASTAQARYWHSSQSLFERAIAVTRDNWLAHNDLGVLLQAQGRTEEALGHFQEMLRISGNFSFEGWSNIRGAYTALGRHDEAVAAGRKALQIRPGVTANLNLGETLQKAGRHEEALRHFQAVLAAQPDLPEAHHAAGLSLDMLGRFREAQISYETALRYRPDYPEALINLSAVLAQTGRLPEAIAHLRKALQTAPENFEAHVNLATALIASGDAKAATHEYEAALAIRPEAEMVRRKLAAVRAGL